MKQSARQVLKKAKEALEHQNEILKDNEKIWQATWESAINPFEAVIHYKNDAPKRKPIIDAWLAARDHYDSLPKPKN